MALIQQRWVSMPEQADAAHAADSKEAHTDIHQAPNVSHTGEVATADDDSSVVQCGEGPCEAGGSAASARFDAGEMMRSTAADLHLCKAYIVMMSDNLQWGGPSVAGHRATWKCYTYSAVACGRSCARTWGFAAWPGDVCMMHTHSFPPP